MAAAWYLNSIYAAGAVVSVQSGVFMEEDAAEPGGEPRTMSLKRPSDGEAGGQVLCGVWQLLFRCCSCVRLFVPGRCQAARQHRSVGFLLYIVLACPGADPVHHCTTTELSSPMHAVLLACHVLRSQPRGIRCLGRVVLAREAKRVSALGIPQSRWDDDPQLLMGLEPTGLLALFSGLLEHAGLCS